MAHVKWSLLLRLAVPDSCGGLGEPSVGQAVTTRSTDVAHLQVAVAFRMVPHGSAQPLELSGDTFVPITCPPGMLPLQYQSFVLRQ